MLIRVSLCAVQPWSHFRRLFISVVLHFSSLICIKGPGWPLTPHTSVSEGMCLPDVDVPDSKQFIEASVDGSTQSLHAESKPVFKKKRSNSYKSLFKNQLLCVKCLCFHSMFNFIITKHLVFGTESPADTILYSTLCSSPCDGLSAYGWRQSWSFF